MPAATATKRRSSNRREFLQLADTYKPGKHEPLGWYLSEKLDGTRCYWDGGLSRGMSTSQVPWANIMDPKTGRLKKKLKPISTGLWSRYGNPIIAPDWFLNALPACPLDGELHAGRGKFQLCRSICAGDKPDPRFDQIEFAIYSSPSLDQVFRGGEIKNSNMHKVIDPVAMHEFIASRMHKDFRSVPPGSLFEEELLFLRDYLGESGRIHLHQQILIDSLTQIEEQLQRVISLGGEGIVLRDPQATWIPKRHAGILKYKPYHDAEATIIGFTSGRRTDKGSKHLGKIGALITTFHGKRLELSGLNDEEREFASPSSTQHARENPGQDMPPGTDAVKFRMGQDVTFKYRELSDAGIPKEASYFRRAA